MKIERPRYKEYMRRIVVQESKQHLSCVARGHLYWLALSDGSFSSKVDLAGSLNISRWQIIQYLFVREMPLNVIAFLDAEKRALSAKLLERLKILFNDYGSVAMDETALRLSIPHAYMLPIRMRVEILDLGLYVLDVAKLARSNSDRPNLTSFTNNDDTENISANRNLSELFRKDTLNFQAICDAHPAGRIVAVRDFLRNVLLGNDIPDRSTRDRHSHEERKHRDLYMVPSNSNQVADIQLAPGMRRIVDTLQRYGAITPRVSKEVLALITTYGDARVVAATRYLDKKHKMPMMIAVKEIKRILIEVITPGPCESPSRLPRIDS